MKGLWWAAILLGSAFDARAGALNAPAASPRVVPESRLRTYDFCSPKGSLSPRKRLRALTYNIKSGEMQGLGAVVQTLMEIPSDVVALQEVDVGIPRTGFVDQAGEIARQLGFCGVFAAAQDFGIAGQYGIALLSRVPLASFSAHELPRPPGIHGRYSEQRVAIRASLRTADHRSLTIVTTHLSVAAVDREKEADGLQQLLADRQGLPTLLLGDLNADPSSRMLHDLGHPRFPKRLRLRSALADVAPPGATLPTFSAWNPGTQIDHVLLHGRWKVRRLATYRSGASDHLPVLAELQWVDPVVSH